MYFFAGRQWITPAVMSTVNDSQMSDNNQGASNVLALIGASTQGAPNTVVTLGSPQDARSAFGSGDLVDAAVRAFAPSNEVSGPAKVYAIRVNPAVQATGNLLDASSGVALTLASTDYGLYTNQIKVAVAAGTTQGLKLTTTLGLNSYVVDNVYRNAFSIRYSGGQVTAVMTVAATTLTLQAPSGTTVATIDLTVYPTIQQLVDRINTVAGFAASVLDGNGALAALNGLDFVTAQDVKTATYTATANLQAVVDAFNSGAEGYVTATRGATGKPPAVVGYTYLAGGVDGVITNTQWSNAFTVLQTADVNWITPLSSDPAIHAMADAHVQFMSGQGRMERRAVVGCPTGTTDTAAIPLAKAINSDRTSFTHLGGYDYNDAGALVLFPAYVVAAMIAAGFAGSNPGTAMTNKSLRLQGMERKLRDPTDTDALIQGGVLCVQDGPRGVRVVQSVSTWLNNANYNRVEQSVGAALDFTARAIRNVLVDLKGAPGDPITLSLAVSRAESVLRGLAQARPAGPGVLVGDSVNPPYKNITATLVGAVLAVSFQASPVIPVNYIPVTIYAKPYSGTASA